MTPPSRSLPRGSWLLLVLIGALAVVAGWDRGPDPLIDFGRELYVPWRLVEGDVLHRDIAWFNGPLGPWLIEGWMRLFGVSLDALQALNAVIATLAAVLIALVMRRVASEAAAWLGCMVFLVVFVVAQQEAIGNYLFLAPYSHGITFGFTAGLASLLCVTRAAEASPSPRARWLVAAGVFTGLAFLSKAEIFLGTGVGVAAATCALLLNLRTGKDRAAAAGFIALGCSLPIALAGARFAGQIGIGETPLALAGTWPYAFNEEVSSMPFYRKMRGTDDLGSSLRRLAFTTMGIAAFLAVQYQVARQIALRWTSGPGAAIAAFGISFALTAIAFIKVQIVWMLVPLAVVLPLIAACSLIRWSRDRSANAVALVGLSFFAAGLLPKVLLAPLARQYGFVLSVPGCMLAVALLVTWIPKWLEGRRTKAEGQGPSAVLGPQRAAAVAVVVVFALMNVNATRNWFTTKVVDVGEGNDRILAGGWRGQHLRLAYEDLKQRLAPGEELLVLPEGITLNYLLRVKTPTRLVNFMPPELAMFDEAEIVASLEARPPAVVVLVHRPTDNYGFPFFGHGYGDSILDWVQDRYQLDRQIGESPFVPIAESRSKFGVSILVPR